jgi:hypothetical protein
MTGQRRSKGLLQEWIVPAIVVVLGALPLVTTLVAEGFPHQTPSQQANSASGAAPTLPRGKKLVLKDGSFQLVREYRIEGDRVRFYSLDSSQWEEIPQGLVDWDATKKLEAQEAQHDAALVARVHSQEEARQAQVIDIDASLEAAPGVFLPPGVGLFVFDGKAVFPLQEVDTNSKLNKKRAIEQVLVPVIPTRHTISIQGSHASLRIRNSAPEFYIRTAEDREPEIDLVPARVHGGERQILHVDELFHIQQATANALPLQSWELAQRVYRLTLGQALPPGEYALVEINRGGGDEMSIYVWDFGVDAGGKPAAPNSK